MEWSDVRIFLAISREGTLAAAARKIGQSQPTMERRLRALEQDVGQTLFQRTKDGFVLTDEGPPFSRMQSAWKKRRGDGTPDGRAGPSLRGHDPDLSVRLVRRAGADAGGRRVRSDSAPRCRGDHHRCPAPQPIGGEADIVFKNRPFEEPEAVFRRLLHMPYAVYVKAGMVHPRAGDGPGTPLVTIDIAHADMPDAVWLKRMLPRAHVVSRSNDRDVQGRMCALGAGAAVLPECLGDALPGVERVDLGQPSPGRATWVGYHRDMRNLARLRTLLRLVIERLAN